ECLPPPQPPAACTAAGTLFRIPRGVAGLSGHGGDRAASVGGGVVTMHARRRERRPVTLAVAGVSCEAVEPPPRWVTPAAARRFGASPGGHGLCGHGRWSVRGVKVTSAARHSNHRGAVVLCRRLVEHVRRTAYRRWCRSVVRPATGRHLLMPPGHRRMGRVGDGGWYRP